MSVGWQNSQNTSKGRTGMWVFQWRMSPQLVLWAPSVLGGLYSAIDTWLSPFPLLTEAEVEGAETHVPKFSKYTRLRWVNRTGRVILGFQTPRWCCLLSSAEQLSGFRKRLTHMQPPFKINTKDYLRTGKFVHEVLSAKACNKHCVQYDLYLWA